MKRNLDFFMKDRYGMDELSRTALIIGIIVSIANIYFKNPYFNFVLILLFFYFGLYRPLSKNSTKRIIERRKYRDITKPMREFFQKSKIRAQGMQNYKYFHCPNCRNELKVPKGKGKIKITCPYCKHNFIKKT